MARSNSRNPRARESIAQFASLAILNGSPPPDSRLGIIETAARCGVRPTPLRDALSWLAPRGSSAIGKQGFGESASRQDLAEIVRIRTVVERQALRLSTALKRVSPERRRSVRPQRAAEDARVAGRCLDKVKTVLVETLTKPMRKSWPR
jgi:DNA-binding GntR family transcriptional regulator